MSVEAPCLESTVHGHPHLGDRVRDCYRLATWTAGPFLRDPCVDPMNHAHPARPSWRQLWVILSPSISAH